MEVHSSTVAWRTPWTEEPGGLQSTASRRVGHRVTNAHSREVKIPAGSKEGLRCGSQGLLSSCVLEG